jgi:hypothetical protein
MNKRTIAFALAAVLLVALVAFADEKAAPERDQRTPVHFSSRPDNADLYIDGKYVGSTEVVFRLTPGVHTVEMKLDEYETWSRQLSVTAENPTRVAARLKLQK